MFVHVRLRDSTGQCKCLHLATRRGQTTLCRVDGRRYSVLAIDRLLIGYGIAQFSDSCCGYPTCCCQTIEQQASLHIQPRQQQATRWSGRTLSVRWARQPVACLLHPGGCASACAWQALSGWASNLMWFGATQFSKSYLCIGKQNFRSRSNIWIQVAGDLAKLAAAAAACC